MNKTINVNLAGIIFNIEEDAYLKLDSYLKSVKAHFSGQPNAEEIVSDIEARAAEHFLQSSGQNKIVSVAQVETLISQMGKVEDFSEPDSKQNYDFDSRGTVPQKHLYRNPDDVIVAGVGSGIAAYFGINTTLVRIIMFLLVISGGFGLMLYLVLWLIVPEAKTQTEKLQMRGEALNLNDIQETVKKRVEEIKHYKDSPLHSLVRGVGKLISKVILIISKIIGVCIALFGSVLIVIGTFTALNLLINGKSASLEFPLAQVVPAPLYHIAILLLYFFIVIPVIVVIVGAISLLRRKLLFNARSFAILITLWIALGMTEGLIAVRYAPEWRAQVESLPQYQVVNRSYDFKDFDKLDLHGVDSIQLIQSPNFEVTAHGRKIDIDRVAFKNEKNTLTFVQSSYGHMCYFCGGRKRVEVEIKMPNISEVSVGGLTQLTGENISSENLRIYLTGGSRAEVIVHAKNLEADLSGSSRLILSGDAQSLTARSSGYSFIDALNFPVADASVDLSGASYNRIFSSHSLKVDASGASQLAYNSNGISPTQKTLSGSSSIIKAGETDDRYEEFGY